jgi:hypothetical protein
MNQDVTRAPRRGKEGRNERGGGRLGQIDPQSRLSGEQGLHRGREACTDSDVGSPGAHPKRRDAALGRQGRTSNIQDGGEGGKEERTTRDRDRERGDRERPER